MCSHTPAFTLVPWPRSAGLTVLSLLTTQEIHPYICYVEDFPCTLLERFSSVFFFPKTVLLRNSFAHLLLSTVIQAKGLLWKWESFLPVNGSNTMTRSMQPSSLYKLLLLNYLSCLVFFPLAKAGDTRLGQTHHLRLIRSFRVQRPIQKIKTKLLVEHANWDSIQNLYAALLFYFQLGGLYVPISVARVILCGHLEVSCCGTE